MSWALLNSDIFSMFQNITVKNSTYTSFNLTSLYCSLIQMQHSVTTVGMNVSIHSPLRLRGRRTHALRCENVSLNRYANSHWQPLLTKWHRVFPPKCPQWYFTAVNAALFVWKTRQLEITALKQSRQRQRCCQSQDSFCGPSFLWLCQHTARRLFTAALLSHSAVTETKHRHESGIPLSRVAFRVPGLAVMLS